MSDAIDLNGLKKRMESAVSAFQHDLSGLRTGRAAPNLLDPVMVKAYGSEVPLNQVANVTVPEPRMLLVNVWDKGMVGAVERGIRDSGLQLNPMSEGQSVRVPLPELPVAPVVHVVADDHGAGPCPSRLTRPSGSPEDRRTRRRS